MVWNEFSDFIVRTRSGSWSSYDQCGSTSLVFRSVFEPFLFLISVSGKMPDVRHPVRRTVCILWFIIVLNIFLYVKNPAKKDREIRSKRYKTFCAKCSKRKKKYAEKAQKGTKVSWKMLRGCEKLSGGWNVFVCLYTSKYTCLYTSKLSSIISTISSCRTPCAKFVQCPTCT